MDSRRQIFILSPAHCGGRRAGYLLKDKKPTFELARRMHEGEPVPLSEIFSFVSGLYFRGKTAYYRAFARPPKGLPGGLVITPNQGLVPAETPTSLDQLRGMSTVDINENEPLYREPLERDVAQLKELAGEDCDFVLLGSIATGKYVNVLLEHLEERLLFPHDFVGRGDMSRGGLLLRCADSGEELAYSPVAGAVRHGARPAKLAPRRPPGL